MPVLIVVGVFAALVPVLLAWHGFRALARQAQESAMKRPRLAYGFLVVLFAIGVPAFIEVNEAFWLIPILAGIGIGAWWSVSHERAALVTAIDLTMQHARELAVRKRQLIVRSRYGETDRRRWDREIGSFISGVITPKIGKVEWGSRLYCDVFAAVETAAEGVKLSNAFHDGLSPIEYESYVSEVLAHLGWQTRVTQASGDQGVDVVALKDGRKLVIQCKLYRHPVGNAAVQEVIAGREFEQADLAAVVTNSTFTKSAEQLAQAAGVLLLHHDEIDRLTAHI